MRQTSAFFALLTALVTGLAATFIYLFSIADLIGLRTTFALLTLLLQIYLVLEVNRVRCLHPMRWFINPAVLCSLMTFVFGYGITNLLYFLSEDFVALISMQPEVTASMNKLLLLVVIGAIAMWLGYWSPLAARLTVRGALVRLRTRFFKVNTAPKAWVLPGLMLVSLVSRLFQVQLGIFGFTSLFELRVGAASYTQYLSMGASLGKLALVVAAFQYFSPHLGWRPRIWFFGIFTYELLFGFLTGFKGAVVMPFIIVVLCQYLRIGRIPLYGLIAIPLALVVAFAVIEPFRQATNKYDGPQDTSLKRVANTIIDSKSILSAADYETGYVREKAPFLLKIMGRLNHTSVGAVGITFADDNENLPAGSPKFLSDIILAPLHAWIPRFLWEGKSLANHGIWYTRNVIGHDQSYATSMGPFTYLYFAGGAIVVFVGLFFIGFIQRVIFFITQPWISTSGGIVFLSMLWNIAIIESAFNGLMISFFRELPLILVLVAFFYAQIRIVSR